MCLFPSAKDKPTQPTGQTPALHHGEGALPGAMWQGPLLRKDKSILPLEGLAAASQQWAPHYGRYIKQRRGVKEVIACLETPAHPP